MTILNPDNVIDDSLLAAFGLPTYLQIMMEASQEDFSASDRFRKMYNGYYRVRQKSPDWYNRYYGLMVAQRKDRLPFEELLQQMYEVKHSVEASFVSKLIATVDPCQPIWDQYVLKNLGLWELWQDTASFPREKRIEVARQIYYTIQEWYREFLESSDGQDCIGRFDHCLPHYADSVSSVKKIDFFLWTKHQPR